MAGTAPGPRCAAQIDREHAQKPLLESIRLQPGASCLDRERLVAHVRMWLVDSAHVPEVHVNVIGDARDARAIAFELRRGPRVRRRVFEQAPKSCDDLHAVLGLAIALAIDAEHMQLRWLEPPPAFEPRWSAALQLSASYGLPLAGALGLQVGAECILLPWLSARADALWQLSANNSLSGSTGRFSTLLGAGSLQICAGGEADPRVRVALCSGAALGVLHAWGTGFARNDSGSAAVLVLRTGVRFEARLGLRWVFDADVLTSVWMPGFYAGHARELGPALTRAPTSHALMLSLGPALVF